MKKQFQLILILLFGAFYLFSGIIKIIDIDNFLYLIRSYNIKLFLYLALTIPVIEITLGLMLVLRKRIKEAVFFSIILLIFFTLIFSYGHFIHKISDCGCFGGIEFLKMSPVVFFIRNGILILLSIYIFYNIEKSKKDNLFSLYQIILLVIVILTSALFVGTRANINEYLKETPYTKSTIDEYQLNSFVNKNINETLLSQYITTSKDSTYFVFIFSYNCPHCLSSSIRLNKYIENKAFDRVVGISKGTRKQKRLYDEIIKPQFEYNKIRYIEMSEITAFFPLSFYIEKDTIRYRIKGTLPEYSKFKEIYQNKNQ